LYGPLAAAPQPAPATRQARPLTGSVPLDVLWILGIIALAVVVALTAKGVEKL
jgi:hypothetical protein